jgi:peptidoglycan/LPS O-acetylase OafA/YrhL
MNSISTPLRSNNLFNAIRLIAATLVLVSHAYVFFEGYNPMLFGQFTLGQVGVWMFFAVSGYLVSKSWRMDPHVMRFLVRRSLRIFPALIVCVLLTVLMLGPLVTRLDWKTYYSSSATWAYLTNIALYITYTLPGVFESNRYPGAVNGSLWSLPAEFFMYLCVVIIGLFNLRSWLHVAAGVVFLVFSFFWAYPAAEPLVVYRTDVRQIVMCGAVFFIGVLIDRFALASTMNLKTALFASVVLMVASYYSINMHLIFSLCLPVITLSISFTTTKQKILSEWDISYGLYLYSFPIQQTLSMYFPALDVWLSIMIALVLSVLAGAASWKLVEKKCLLLKPNKAVNNKMAGT